MDCAALKNSKNSGGNSLCLTPGGVILSIIVVRIIYKKAFSSLLSLPKNCSFVFLFVKTCLCCLQNTANVLSCSVALRIIYFYLFIAFFWTSDCFLFTLKSLDPFSCPFYTQATMNVEFILFFFSRWGLDRKIL